MPEERKQIPIECYNATNYEKGWWLQQLENDALMDVLQETPFLPSFCEVVKPKIRVVGRSGKGSGKKHPDLDNIIGIIFHKELRPYLLAQENKNLFELQSVGAVIRRFQQRDMPKFKKAERYGLVKKGKYQRVLTIAAPEEYLREYRSDLESLCRMFRFKLFTYPDPILSEPEEYEIDLAQEYAEQKLEIVWKIYEKYYSKREPYTIRD